MERELAATHCQFLDGVWAVVYLVHYPEGDWIIFETDEEKLNWLLTKSTQLENLHDKDDGLQSSNLTMFILPALNVKQQMPCQDCQQPESIGKNSVTT